MNTMMINNREYELEWSLRVQKAFLQKYGTSFDPAEGKSSIEQLEVLTFLIAQMINAKIARDNYENNTSEPYIPLEVMDLYMSMDEMDTYSRLVQEAKKKSAPEKIEVIPQNKKNEKSVNPS